MKIRQIIERLLKSDAVKGTLFITVGSLVASVFSYLLQFILGRFLTLEDFGIFNTLLSISVIFSVFSSSVSTSLIKLVSDLKIKDGFSVLTKMFSYLTFSSFLFGLFFAILLVIFSDIVAGFFHIDNTNYILAFSLFIAFSFVNIIPSSYLQGFLRFKAFSFWNCVSSFLRLLIPAIIVLLGYSVGGVYLGILFAAILSYFISLVLLKKNFRVFNNEALKPHFKQIFKLLWVVMFIRLGMTTLNNVDLMLIKHFFSGEAAGVYAGVVTLGKIIIFGAGSVSIAMFPQISESYSKKENVFEKFKPFFLLQVVLILGGIALFVLFPKFITVTLFGNKFLSSVKYLPSFSIFMGLYVLINFLTMFFLAIEKTGIFVFQLFGVFLQTVLIYLYHNSLNQVIYMNILTAAILSVSLLGYYMYLLVRQKNHLGVFHTNS